MTDDELIEKVARAIESAFGKSLHGAARAAIAAVREAEAEEIDWLRAENERLRAALEGVINEAVGMADGKDEAVYIERRLRAALQET